MVFQFSGSVFLLGKSLIFGGEMGNKYNLYVASPILHKVGITKIGTKLAHLLPLPIRRQVRAWDPGNHANVPIRHRAPLLPSGNRRIPDFG